MLANAGSAAASLGENGNIHKPWYSGWFSSQRLPLPPLELCALSEAGAQGAARSFHRRVKHSISKALPTARCSNNPSLLLCAFQPKLWLLPAGLIVA